MGFRIDGLDLPSEWWHILIADSARGTYCYFRDRFTGGGLVRELEDQIQLGLYYENQIGRSLLYYEIYSHQQETQMLAKLSAMRPIPPQEMLSMLDYWPYMKTNTKTEQVIAD